MLKLQETPRNFKKTYCQSPSSCSSFSLSVLPWINSTKIIMDLNNNHYHWNYFFKVINRWVKRLSSVICLFRRNIFDQNRLLWRRNEGIYYLIYQQHFSGSSAQIFRIDLVTESLIKQYLLGHFDFFIVLFFEGVMQDTWFSIFFIMMVFVKAFIISSISKNRGMVQGFPRWGGGFRN